MSKLSFRSADGHLGLGAIRLRGSRRSSPGPVLASSPQLSGRQSACSFLWDFWDPAPLLEGSNCTKLSAVFPLLSFFHIVLCRNIFMFLPYRWQSTLLSSPDASWPIFTILHHFCQGWGWEVGTRCLCSLRPLRAISGKIILRQELCRQYFCFMFCLCADIYYMWYYSHRYTWYASKPHAYMGQFLFLGSLMQSWKWKLWRYRRALVIGLQIFPITIFLHLLIELAKTTFSKLIAWCCLCQWNLKFKMDNSDFEDKVYCYHYFFLGSKDSSGRNTPERLL